MRRWFAAAVALFVGCATSDPAVDPTSSSGSPGGGDGGFGAYGGYGGAGGFGAYGGHGGAGGFGGEGGAGASAGCGDGLVDPGEECDDANEIDGDGCSYCLVDCEPEAAKEPITGHCYRVFSTAATWATAEANCQAWGGAAGVGHLVSIADMSEQIFVASLVTEHSWIGGGDKVKEGLYTWTDGSPWIYELWAPNEPNDTTVEDCVFMRADGDWDDHDCAYKWPAYVCERSAVTL